jgi:hypothetical protein
MIVGGLGVYTINYINKNHLPINSTILIGIPDDVIISTNSSLIINCGINSIIKSADITIINVPTIYYNQAINISGLIRTVLAANSQIQLNISFLVNPNSTKTTNSFSIFTYFQSYLI